MNKTISPQPDDKKIDSAQPAKPAVVIEKKRDRTGMQRKNVKLQTPHIPAQDLTERWILIDASGQIVGKLTAIITKLLMGKDLGTYNPAVVSKTNVVVINAEKVRFTGNKMATKEYHKHSGYPGGLKSMTAQSILEGPDPTRILTHAVLGMLPKNKLRLVMMRHLKVFVGENHPHAGQSPIAFKL